MNSNALVSATAARRARRWLPQTRYVDFLPDAQYVGERNHSPMASALIGLIVLLAVTTVVWAGLAEVEQAVSAPGQVRPIGRVSVINHTEGGRVAKIHVREGDPVAPGQPLLEIDGMLIQAELSRLIGEGRSLEAEMSRLQAEAEGASLRFSETLRERGPDLVRAQQRLFAARQDALLIRKSASEESIRQRHSELKALLARLKKQRASQEVLVEQSAKLTEATKEGHYPKIRLLAVARELTDARGDVLETEQDLAAAEAALAEARSQHERIRMDWREQVLIELEARRRERETNATEILQHQERLRNTLIRAPRAGIVQGLSVRNIGQAVSANEPLMNIVPADGHLVIEAQVDSGDIGYVEPGQSATVKVHTYDFVRYGSLAGTIERIAADATQDQENGTVAYTVTVRTERSHLGRKPGERALMPGMMVDVELKTGERTVLSYFTERLVAATDAALKEH